MNDLHPSFSIRSPDDFYGILRSGLSGQHREEIAYLMDPLRSA
jgi:hypothetical protein